MNDDIKSAIETLKNGGVGIFPTDTVFGIGCRLDDIESIKRLFKIRNRPNEKAVLAVVDSIDMAQKYLLPIPSDVKEKLMDKYWPGGLTIVLPCDTKMVPSVARGGGLTLGVRQTNHPVLLKILKEVKVPICAPSANFAGGITPKTFDEIDNNLIKLVDFAIDMPCGGNMPSTVIDCSVSPWKILRQGAVNTRI
ncbi:MAG TPA: L-threonylcarbamoyladenylate synthase [Patescibacteria group bacterium]